MRGMSLGIVAPALVATYKETFSFTDAPDATASDVQKCKRKQRN